MAKRTQTTTPDAPAPDTPDPDRTLPPAGETAPAVRPERSPAPGPRPPAAGNGRPADPAEMRREIERTRARMSSTLDAVEARIAHERRSLERKKDELVDRATMKGLREKLTREPWRSMAIAFAAGYIIAAIRD